MKKFDDFNRWLHNLRAPNLIGDAGLDFYRLCNCEKICV